MRTLLHAQFRGYNEPGLEQPLHVPIITESDGREVPENGVPDNDLPAYAQGAVAQILNASRELLGLPADAPIMAQIDARDRSIRAGLRNGPLPVLDAEALPDNVPGAISIALLALAIKAGVALPSTAP